MSFRQVGGSVLQRSSESLPLPGSSTTSVLTPTGASQRPLPPQGLTPRSASASSSPRPRIPLPALATPSTAATVSRGDDLTAPGLHAPPSPSNEAPDKVRQRLQREVHKRTDLVGWLESWRKDVEDQAERVLQRLNQARQELADRAAIPISTAAEWRQLNQLKEQVSMLQWRHGELGPRQQDAARVLQEERTRLAAAQDRLSAMGPAPAPPPPSPPSTPVSEASFATASAFTSYHTPEYNPEGSIASDVASADLRQQRVAQLQRQASELGRRAQALEERLKAVTEESTELAPEVKKAEAQYKASEDRIAWALAEGDAGRRAGFETAQVRLYLHMDGLRQQAEGLGRSRDALAAQLDAVRGELNEARRQLVEAGVSAHHSSSSVRSETDANLLEAALPHGGAAVARLAERTARRSPRTPGEQLRTLFKGRPKPLEGKRLKSFTQLVHADVMAVARQGNLPPDDAANLMRSAVTRGALGAALAQEDRSELLAALNRVQVHLAAQEEP